MIQIRGALACSAVLLCALAGSALRAEPEKAPAAPIPDTAAGRRFADLMALADARDEAGIAAYVKEHFTPEMQKAGPRDPGIVPFLVNTAKRFGGFEVVRVIASTPDQVTMLVRPRSESNRWLRYNVKVQAARPHRVEGLFLMPASPGDIPAGDGEIGPAEAVAAFEKEVDRVAASGTFSGVVLLARGKDIVLQRATGEANREHHVPMAVDTVFGLASMNKMFTAVAIGRLVEQGRVAWSDPVAKHLRGWLPDGPAGKITIQQLLTHTSGLGDYLERIADDPKIRDARTLSAYQDLVRASRLEGPPDGTLRYSNTGYVVLGALIEAVTGRSYFDVIQDEIYARAGMTSSGSWCVDEVVEKRATGYLRPEEAEAAELGRGWRSNARLQGARGTSAGGGLSTAGDLLRFAGALLDGTLVKRETLDELLKPRVRFPVGGDYAYGFVVHTGKDGKRVFGHAGGFPGVNGELKVYGDGAWTLIVLANVSGAAGDLVGAWDGIVARLAP